jgi:2-polyprenyl-3-methyl-5-hydroxy-6-metoxy-1,4-benzoquinol methylase
MIDQILNTFKNSDYDFREHANPEDPLSNLFEEWVDYYRMKWAIAKVLQPKSILEIGVRFGYSACAFLNASPEAQLVGIDADLPFFGGASGAMDWADKELSEKYSVSFIRCNSQTLSRFPGSFYDLIHVDGQQDGDGTFHDLDLASMQARFILVDGYFWTRNNFLAVNEWLWLNKAGIEASIIVPGYAGELLIQTKLSSQSAKHFQDSASLAHTYTADYYLCDCGGYDLWRRSDGKAADPRLQTVAAVAMALRKPDKVIDLGAGRGELTRIFALQGARVTAIDYSADAVGLIKKTMDDIGTSNVDVICDSVLNPEVYADSYDLAVAADLIEHLSPEEDDSLYKLVSRKLKPVNGAFVIHTAPNLWCYRYEHARQQKAAIQAGFWLPRTRRTWYERLMHVNEQNPRILKKQLSRHFPYVYVWFADEQGMGGSLLRKFGLSDFRRAQSLFAIASHTPLDIEQLSNLFKMDPLDLQESKQIMTTIEKCTEHVTPGEVFYVRIELDNCTTRYLSSSPPNPVNLSYHWWNESEEVVVFDGLRTTLQPGLQGRTKVTYDVSVEAPQCPGLFTLQILPVQEMVRWHDDACRNSVKVRVVDSFNHNKSGSE